MIKLTQEIWDKIIEINDYWNNNLHYRKDINKHNKLDYWDSPNNIIKTMSGDCEEYALIKQYYLSKESIPSDIAICKINKLSKVGHAVCVIDTDKGTFILDNRYYDVFTYEESIKRGYIWYKRQNGKLWFTILSFFSLFLLYQDASNDYQQEQQD